MSGIQRLTPSKGSSMRADDEGPYVRYADHVDEVARVEAANIHLRATLRTGPLDLAYERQKAEIARLHAQNDKLSAKARTYAKALNYLTAGNRRSRPSAHEASAKTSLPAASRIRRPLP
jgi:hypothetical protein